jgi:hypothetical protein
VELAFWGSILTPEGIVAYNNTLYQSNGGIARVRSGTKQLLYFMQITDIHIFIYKKDIFYL